MNNMFLYEEIEALRKYSFAESALSDFSDKYGYILKNLNPNKPIRDYQMRCLENFHLYNSLMKKGKQDWHLFHMATGSGKTYIMAALILYYFKQGYRNFLFFVNQRNIVEKTKQNFLAKGHSKYLFNDSIVIDGKRIDINSVSSFQENKKDCINILFTTIQDLHSSLNNISENGISMDDFNEEIVMIADEAHHLNANTKNKKEQENTKHWETTVNDIFKQNNSSVMLEFTATCDLDNSNIKDKYMGNPADIIFNFPLIEFRRSGYTKELENIKTGLEKTKRIIQAMILSQYRLKLFESDDINIAVKPIILCKESNTIEELKSTCEIFCDYLENKFSRDDLNQIRQQASGFVQEAFAYFDENGISDENLIAELRVAFSRNHIICVHSDRKDLPQLQVELNDLENPKNPYRMIFTVDMLTEGWDVLNLFDIVRLYDERKTSGKKISATTIQEAQLIGRGARYFPYKLQKDELTHNLDVDKRKFGEDDNNSLRICDTLLYHCIDETNYRSELKRALIKTGFDDSESDFSYEYHLKDSFKKSDDYNNGVLFINHRIEVEAGDNSHLLSDMNIHIETHEIQKLKTGSLLLEDSLESESNSETNHIISVKDINHRIVYKALRQFSAFEFNKLQSIFPSLESVYEFISSDDYAGRFELNIFRSREVNNIDIYNALLLLFDQLSYKITSLKPKYRGSTEFRTVKMRDYITDVNRKKHFSDDEVEEKQGEGVSQNSSKVNSQFRLDLSDKKWFVYDDNYGTTEEKRFVKFFYERIELLKKKYDKILLIRNEQKVKIYDFTDGRAFEPDYILILKNEGSNVEQHIFIEPKGQHLVATDKWKEDFLTELENVAQCEEYQSNDQYRIVGLPFYTHQNDSEFKRRFEGLYQQ